jgi:hypothetical protein
MNGNRLMGGNRNFGAGGSQFGGSQFGGSQFGGSQFGGNFGARGPQAGRNFARRASAPQAVDAEAGVPETRVARDVRSQVSGSSSHSNAGSSQVGGKSHVHTVNQPVAPTGSRKAVHSVHGV